MIPISRQGISNTTRNAKSVLDFTDFCYLPLSQLKFLDFEESG